MRALGQRSIASFVKSVLDVAWWLLLVSLGLLTVLLACSTFVDLRGGNLTVSLPVAVQFDAPVHGVDGETTARFGKLHGELKFPVQPGVFLTGSVALAALLLGLLLWIVTEVRNVFRSLSLGMPFVVANARRIRRVGIGVIVAELANTAIVYFWSAYASERFTAGGLSFTASVDVNLITIVGGLVILVIAEVFQEGARLQEEQSLTI